MTEIPAVPDYGISSETGRWRTPGSDAVRRIRPAPIPVNPAVLTSGWKKRSARYVHGIGGSRPISRVLSRTVIHLDAASPQVSSNLPGSHAGRTFAPLFGLAPGGVCPATPVTSRAVRSCRTISPLPALPDHRQGRRYIFCGTFHGLAPSRCYLAPCPVEPGLSSLLAQSDCLADSRHEV